MAGKVLNLLDYVTPDQLGCKIANQWVEWNNLRADWVKLKKELRQYLYATDTSQTSNYQLPWNNKTTIPKLCQINDNLLANYMASFFPSSKRNWLDWTADIASANSVQKRKAILAYMGWATKYPQFKTEMTKCTQDFIQYGNTFGTVEWIDERQQLDDKTTVGYCGPAPRRISPLDIVFNPTATSFYETPKIVRTLTTMGEVKKIIDSLSTDENKKAYEELFEYLKKTRTSIQSSAGDFQNEDASYKVDGFTSFRSYLLSDFVEILTFYGDIFDYTTGELLENHKIMVVDRHKILSKAPNPSYFGYAPIFHVGWRVRQDNLWAMGPLDNLVGMQYRIDHLENMKADMVDLTRFPPLKIKGYVEDFEWGPFERIYTGDDGDVEIMQAQYNSQQSDVDIQTYMNLMEEAAGAPKEAMGFRTPGEKTAFEVQRQENAASRIFNNKTVAFEENFIERICNAMLELARRNISETQTIPVFNDDFNFQQFIQLTPADITGAGRLKPIAARHFAEQAELVQNLSNFANSAIGQDPAVTAHISGLGMARLFEEILNIGDLGIVQPNVRIAEQAETQKIATAAQEQNMMESQTPTGLTPDDVDPSMVQPGMEALSAAAQ